MCVNAAKKQEYANKITQLNDELNNENAKLENINKAKGEVQELINEAQCAIDNLSNCNFGGTKILNSVELSQQGYQDRMDYYDDYIIKCNNAISAIQNEIDINTAAMEALPVPCGTCYECAPPEPVEQKNGTVWYIN